MEIYNVDKAKYEGVYGKGFISDISRSCEMANLWTRQGLSDDEVATGHYIGGYRSHNRLKEVLADHNLHFGGLNSLLDFASGFGRTTRFFVQELDPSKITVSDITSEGVDYQKAKFGVSGFNSTNEPEDLHHDGKYQVIFANSLFSHLNLDHFTRWLTKLSSFLEPGGLLLFSTHGYSFFKKRTESDRNIMMANSPAKGFFFWSANETIGRLNPDIYGTTFVIPGFVKKLVKDHGLGEITKSYNPMPGFMAGQDIYVLKRT